MTPELPQPLPICSPPPRPAGRLRRATRDLGFLGTVISVAPFLALLAAAPVVAQERTDPDPAAQESAAQESATQVEPTAPAPPRATFSVNLGANQGGGRVTGSAGDYQFRPGQSLVATDGVEIKFRDLVIAAERVRLDIPANSLTAEGNVVLDEGPERLAGDLLEYDLDTRTGRITNASAYVDPGYYFSGDEINKTGAQTYTIEDGVFTSCEGDSPAWSFAMSSASITLEEYARIRNARLRFGKVPVFYFPYVLWPATTERASGFLVPKPGYSDRLGAHISMAYFRELGRSADMTFYGDLSSEEYFGAGLEYRYRPSERTTGVFDAYFRAEPIQDLQEFNDDPRFDPDYENGDDRWKVTWAHETTELWDRFRGVVNLQLYSDVDYLQDVERRFDRQTQPFIYSNAYLTSNRGNHSFNIMIDQRELISGNRTRNTRRQLPEIEYKIRPTRIGRSEIYYGLESAAHYFSIDVEDAPPADPTMERETRSLEYGRLDFAPSVSIPLSTLSWLSAKATLSGRVTHYTKTTAEEELLPDSDLEPLSGDSLTRAFPAATVEIIGPSFLRIFESSSRRYSKMKHIVEPRVTYFWRSDDWLEDDYLDAGVFDELDAIPVFDSIDSIRPANAARVSVTNRLMAKPREEGGDGAFEIASLEVRQDVNFNEIPGQRSLDGSTSDRGPLVSSLRVNPSSTTSFKLDVQYNTLQSQLSSLSLSGGTKLSDRHSVSLSWLTRWREQFVPGTTATEDMPRPTEFVTSSDQLRFGGNFEIIRDKLTIGTQLTYNLDDPNPVVRDGETFVPSRLINQRYVLDYRGSCYNWMLEYRENQYQLFDDSELRFSLSLKNVGTFLDLTESF